MSGTFIGGSGRLTSSKAMLSFIPGLRSGCGGSIPSGESSAAAIAASTSIRPFSGGGGYTIREPRGRRSSRDDSPEGNSGGGGGGARRGPKCPAGVNRRRRRVLVPLDAPRLALGGGATALGALDHPG